VKGVSHVDPELAFGLSMRGFRGIPFDRFTRRSLSWVDRREESYDLWRVGAGYENSTRWSASLDVRDLKIRTAYTLQESLAAVVRKLRVSVVLVLLAFLSGALLLIGNVPGIVGIPLILVAAAAFFFNLRSAYRLGKAMLVEYRPDAILRDTPCSLPCKTQVSWAKAFSQNPFAWPRSPTATRSPWRMPRLKTPPSSSVRTARFSRRCATSGI
jgi:hypothetical protein